jgi:hypothetical protein
LAVPRNLNVPPSCSNLSPASHCFQLRLSGCLPSHYGTTLTMIVIPRGRSRTPPQYCVPPVPVFRNRVRPRLHKLIPIESERREIVKSHPNPRWIWVPVPCRSVAPASYCSLYVRSRSHTYVFRSRRNSLAPSSPLGSFCPDVGCGYV